MPRPTAEATRVWRIKPLGNGDYKDFVPGHIQLCCTAGIFAIHMSSYVVGRGSAVVAVEGR